MHNRFFLLPAILSFFVITICSGDARASLLTTDTISNSTVITFADQSPQRGVFGSVQIGSLVGENVTVASSSGSNGLYFNYNGWSLGANGTWGSPQTYVALNGNADKIIFSFNDSPVAAVGGFMNYAKNVYTTDLIITALDSQKNSIASYDITQLADIVTPNAPNGGAFRGIDVGTNNVSYFEISGGYANAITNLTFGRVSAIPLPGTLPLFASGLVGLVLLHWRRKKKAAAI